MTLSEAQSLAQIISAAAGGYPPVVIDLVERLNASFPAFVWTTQFSLQMDPAFVASPVEVRMAGP